MLFYQIYSIHVWHNNYVFPCVYALLPKKSKACYNKFFRNLKSKSTELGFTLNPSVFVVDFKIALIQDARENFENIKIQGCFFHHTKCLYKHIKKFNLYKTYQEDRSMNTWLGKWKPLAFVPQERMREAWTILMEDVPDTADLDKVLLLANYFGNTWFQLFPIDTWNHYQNYKSRTNNHVEGFHKK